MWRHYYCSMFVKTDPGVLGKLIVLINYHVVFLNCGGPIEQFLVPASAP